jgi:hypothetical protein
MMAVHCQSLHSQVGTMQSPCPSIQDVAVGIDVDVVESRWYITSAIVTSKTSTPVETLVSWKQINTLTTGRWFITINLP